jgi:hypothetical protein
MGARDYLGGGGAASSADQERTVIAAVNGRYNLTAFRDIRPRAVPSPQGKLRHERPK